MRPSAALKKGIWILLLAFTVSVAVRLPHLNRPLSTNYEWVTAHTLVTLQIWAEEGIFAHGFNPIYTFSNPNDHYIKCPISGISDDAGNYYYVSYPPLSFIAPHLVFSLFNIAPTVLTLQIFNLALHFLCGLLVYLALMMLTSSKDDTRQNVWPAALGASIYFFAPLNLWHHGNIYFADIFVQLLFILDIYLVLRILNNQEKNASLVGMLTVALFLTMYTEWLGYLFSFVLFLYALSQLKKLPVARVLAISCVVATTFALGLTLVQYASIDGFDAFIDTALNRYQERSGQYGKTPFYQLSAHGFLLNLYARNYFPVVILLALLGLLLITYKGSLKRYPIGLLAVLALVPALLHHMALFEFTLVHDLALVKTSVFFSLLIGLLLHGTLNTPVATQSAIYKSLPYVFSVIMMGLCVFFYHAHVIQPTFSLEELGETINEHTDAEDTVFFKTTKTLGDFLIKAPINFVVAPQIQYYSGRCIQVVPTLHEAQQHLQKFNKKQGVVFTIENLNYKVEAIERISASDTLSTAPSNTLPQ